MTAHDFEKRRVAECNQGEFVMSDNGAPQLYLEDPLEKRKKRHKRRGRRGNVSQPGIPSPWPTPADWFSASSEKIVNPLMADQQGQTISAYEARSRDSLQQPPSTIEVLGPFEAATSTPSGPVASYMATPRESAREGDEAAESPFSRAPRQMSLWGLLTYDASRTFAAATTYDNTAQQIAACDLMAAQASYRALMLVCTQMSLGILVMHYVSMITLAAPVDHWCKAPRELGNISTKEWKSTGIPLEADGTLSQCYAYAIAAAPVKTATMTITGSYNEAASRRHRVPCNEWDYDVDHDVRTVVSEWNLVCDYGWIPTAAFTYDHLGGLAPVPFLGQMADRFGRRPAIFASVIVLLAADITTVFTRSLVAFFAARMFAGASSNALALVFLVMLHEVAGGQARHEYVWAAFLAPVLTSLLPSLAAGTVLDRRLLSLVMLSAASLLVPSFYFVGESAQWLKMTCKKPGVERPAYTTSRATSIVPNAAADYGRRRQCQAKQRRLRGFTAIDLLAEKEYRVKTLVLSYLFVLLFAGLHVAFVGTASGLPSSSDATLHDSNKLLLQLVSRSLSLFASDRLLRMQSRREALILALGTVLVTGWAKYAARRIAPRDDHGDPPLVVIVMGELLLDAIFVALVLLCTCTLAAYQTEVRATGLCTVYFSGGIGATLSLILADLESVQLVGGTVAVLAAISATAHLPEPADYEFYLAQIQAHEFERKSDYSVPSSAPSKHDQHNDPRRIVPKTERAGSQ
ncbi:hypothetical protein HPB50_003476 [Hyalomma asiaticum]|uniref:Uncharacterized protein n=1 Tax=Hyalomma asiaticum TaxID=266040 RepID=A0ACB7S0K9_HYAAI|nr:hypothetical protein HPB50_003476 [Hyalomma asiaticum]